MLCGVKQVLVLAASACPSVNVYVSVSFRAKKNEKKLLLRKCNLVDIMYYGQP